MATRENETGNTMQYSKSRIPNYLLAMSKEIAIDAEGKDSERTIYSQLLEGVLEFHSFVVSKWTNHVE